jgi:elongation factor P--(R)-beta-lysine ligase
MRAELRQRLLERARIEATIRDFFRVRGVLEVRTPVLSAAGNTDPNIESFVTRYAGRGGGPSERWLRTSPEYFHKRLLAAGSGDIWEIGSVFRNGEAGRRHNPEFTLLEWYRVGWDHHRLMDEVAALVGALAEAFDRPIGAIERMDYRTLFRRHAALDPFTASDEELEHALSAWMADFKGLSREDRLDLVRTHVIEPALDPSAALFVHDFPAAQAALARVRPGSPPLAERFELYLGSMELANGYHELGDAIEQRARFESDLGVRSERGSMMPPIDENLLSALSDMPACAGVALGVDRLHQWLVQAASITEVLAFAFDRA